MTEIVGKFIDTSLVQRKYGDVLVFQLLQGDAATSANYTTLPFISPTPIEIISISAAWTVASSSGTLQVERLQGTDAPGSGDSILESTIDTSATANTVITRKGKELTSARQLEAGDRLALVDGGTITNLTDLQVTIYYKPRARGDYR